MAVTAATGTWRSTAMQATFSGLHNRLISSGSRCLDTLVAVLSSWHTNAKRPSLPLNTREGQTLLSVPLSIHGAGPISNPGSRSGRKAPLPSLCISLCTRYGPSNDQVVWALVTVVLGIAPDLTDRLGSHHFNGGCDDRQGCASVRFM